MQKRERPRAHQSGSSSAVRFKKRNRGFAKRKKERKIHRIMGIKRKGVSSSTHRSYTYVCINIKLKPIRTINWFEMDILIDL